MINFTVSNITPEPLRALFQVIFNPRPFAHPQVIDTSSPTADTSVVWGASHQLSRVICSVHVFLRCYKMGDKVRAQIPMFTCKFVIISRSIKDVFQWCMTNTQKNHPKIWPRLFEDSFENRTLFSGATWSSAKHLCLDSPNLEGVQGCPECLVSFPCQKSCLAHFQQMFYL